MVFIVKAAYSMGIVKKEKHTKIYDGNPNSGLERRLYMPIFTTWYIFKVSTVKIDLWWGCKNNEADENFRFYCYSEKADLNSFRKSSWKYFRKFKENL